MIYYNKFIEFLKKHNLYQAETYIFISSKTKNINYNNEEERSFIGCYPKTNEKDKLIDFKIYVPEIIDEETVLINIHEYIHALILYYNLNKKYNIGLEKETLPLMFEKLYVLENEEMIFSEYQKDMKEVVNEINTPEYTIGNQIAEELLKEKEYDIQKLNNKAKKLVKNKEI